MRPPLFRAWLDPSELVIDNFAGGGGTSSGLEEALGRPVDIAVNHNPVAIAMHEVNHPETRHYVENIWEVDPKEACGSRRAGIVWFSPDCTHHSRAKGGKPREQGLRGLAWVVIRWCREVKPRHVVVENVPEFETWGPLDDEGRPDRGRSGETFRAWRAAMVDLGYRVEHRVLVAADYGAPTTRRRLFVQARCDGLPITWPEATHGKGAPQPWRLAAEIIDWTIPCPSIFDRARPLAEATMRRIAAGLRRFVLETASPFIVPLTHHGAPRVYGLDEPLRTVTGAHRGELALVAPTLVQRGYGERQGQAPRAMPITDPLGTVVAGGVKHGLVTAFLAKHFGGPNGKQPPGLSPTSPLGAVTAQDHHAVVAAHITKFYGTSTGSAATEPLPTVTAGGGRGGGHLAAVQAFLVKYYGSDGKPQGQSLDRALDTVTSKARFGLVMVHGVPHQIVDIGMRMLVPRELFNAQGFRPDYRIDSDARGRAITKTDQVALAGNSVPPPVAAAIARAAAQQRAEA